jgi:DnaA family protein
MQQIPLAFSPYDAATFGSFLATDTNRLAFQALQQLPAAGVEYSLCYLHGPRGSGRSHLLQALCHRSNECGDRAQYLPLAQLSNYPAEEVLARLKGHAVVCIDDVDRVAGRRDWEVQLFNLLNRTMMLAGTVVVAATRPPDAAGFQLPDLVSRLQQGLVLAVPEPGDDDKARVFVWRAQQRGILVPPRVARFVLTHSGRDLHGLMSLLDDIDAQSLNQQRRITVPFIRELLQLR